ncbi:alpha-L-fucosidase [Flavobacterium mesophilum]|uniref:alpha-L-fucosidase n=1 Tax=Flavobacterium mesophilum TaxID=3143495 RepID=UPI0031E0B905
MKNIKVIITILLLYCALNSVYAQYECPDYLKGYIKIWNTKGPKAANLKWFENAKFGMFVHYSPANQLHNPVVDFTIMNQSWFDNRNNQTLDNYGYKENSKEVYGNAVNPETEQLFKTFDPKNFDADQIADLAVSAGMKYINFTSWHVIGRMFMFDTSVSKWNSKRLYNRDFVAEMAAACQKRGLGLFLYFWPPQDATQEELMQILKELLTNYGPIAGIWFDGIGNAYRKPSAYLEAAKQYALVNALQPQCLISFKTGWVGDEDFLAPEWDQLKFDEKGNPLFPSPASYLKIGEVKVRLLRLVPGGIEWRTQTYNEVWDKNLKGKPIELGNTMIEKSEWFDFKDGHHKSKQQIIEEYKCARKNKSNMILNISPRADGSIHPEDKKVLEGLNSEINSIK